jgi:hypothetical protein
MTTWNIEEVIARHAFSDGICTGDSIPVHRRYVNFERDIMADAIEKWLEDWDREFAYFDGRGVPPPATRVRKS